MPTDGSRPDSSTATRTSCSPATARWNSNSGCRARRTRRSRAPAAASCRPCAPCAQRRRTNCFAQSLPRAPALVRDGVTTLEIKSGYGLDFDNERKMLRVARRIGDALGITVRTTYPRRACLAAGVRTTIADGYIEAVVRLAATVARRGACRRGRRVLRRHRLFADADATRVRRGARARLAGEAARRPAQRPGWRRAGGGIRRLVRRPHRTHVRGRRARDGARGHGRGAAAGRLPCAARNEAAAARRVARARRADGRRDRLQSGHVAAVVAAPGDAAGVHAFPVDAGRSAARRDRARGACAGTCRPRRAARRHARGFRSLADRHAGGTGLLAGWRALVSPAARGLGVAPGAAGASGHRLRTRNRDPAAGALEPRLIAQQKSPARRGFSCTRDAVRYLAVVFLATTFLAGALAAVLVAVFFTTGAA